MLSIKKLTAFAGRALKRVFVRIQGAAPAGLLASAWAWWWLHRTYDKNHTEGFGT